LRSNENGRVLERIRTIEVKEKEKEKDVGKMWSVGVGNMGGGP
jgi:hypothetical protein